MPLPISRSSAATPNAVVNEYTPLTIGNANMADDYHESSQAQPAQKQSRSRGHLTLFHGLYLIRGGIYTPSTSTYEPVELLLNAETREERDRLTDRWRDCRVNELNFIGVVVSAIANLQLSQLSISSPDESLFFQDQASELSHYCIRRKSHSRLCFAYASALSVSSRPDNCRPYRLPFLLGC